MFIFERVLTFFNEYAGLSSSLIRELFFRLVKLLELSFADSSSVIKESSNFTVFLRVDLLETLLVRLSSESLAGCFAFPARVVRRLFGGE